MYIPDVINTLLMGLIFIVIVVTVVRPIMLNLVHSQVDGDDIQKMVNQEVNKHLIRHFQDAAAQRTAEIRFQKLLLDVPKKPERDVPDPELEDDEEDIVAAPQAQAPVAEPVEEAPAAVEEEAVAEETTQVEGEGVSSEADTEEDGETAESSEEDDMAEGEIEIREGESLAEIKERMKREQKQAKKPAIPPELLNNANSYEDKVGVVRMVVQADHSRVASLVRSMIQDELQKGVK